MTFFPLHSYCIRYAPELRIYFSTGTGQTDVQSFYINNVCTFINSASTMDLFASCNSIMYLWMIMPDCHATELEPTPATLRVTLGKLVLA